MNRTRALAGFALVSMAVAAGCGGGGGGTSPIPHASTAPASVKFSISVPLQSQSSTAREPNFDAPGGTQSVSISLSSVNGTKQSGQPTVANLSSSASGCSASGSTLTCSVTVPAQAGTDVFTVTSYPQPDAKGTPIATGTAAVTTSAGQTTTAPVTLSGTIASITLSLGGVPIQGVATSIPLVVVAKDSSGATIMGTYDHAIALTDSDSSGVTKLSATTLADSTAASAVTIAYNGGSLSTAAQFGASEGSLPATAITGVSFQPNNDYTVQNGATLTYAVSTWSQSTVGTNTPSPASTGGATLTAAFSTGATFNKQSNLIDVKDTLSNGTGSIFLGAGGSNDTYFAWVPSKTGADLYQVGSLYTYVDGYNHTQTYQDTFSAPGMHFAQVPFASGNSWNAAAEGLSTATYPQYDSTGAVTGTYNDTYDWKADGSYDDTSTYASADNTTKSSDHWMANSDGSYDENSAYTDATSSSVEVYTIGTPAPAPSGTPGMAIKYTDVQTQTSPAPTATSTPDVWYGPDWYPTGKPPMPLETDVTTDLGSGALPAQCNIPTTLATTAEHLQEKYVDTDPWGYVDTRTSDYYYTPGIGLVCMSEDLVNNYYDTNTTGQVSQTYEWKDTEALTTVSLQSALRKTNSMTAAAAFASAGLQAGVAQLHQRIAIQQQTMKRRARFAARLHRLH